ncbi:MULTISPECIES: polyprenyl synthetase family protein [Streptomyces]|uniref:polyprenyl synthetase family protein n=1 Tax=Streptomyces TaxID=1883 RepID=UPI00163BA056|nr:MULTISPECIES: polyprenyl synthetase family protein [Streptomyces]MBC2879417.1 polyprenyl synthetase family protein [Streptomyces sp. TYQ1024]UBI39817.1 polyprenyl synthetase family protein [Streptomyces mobaraensis]UKW32398.1 polyprenyl synthetase family protein [Streptomyces sp. TYQ1024]
MNDTSLAAALARLASHQRRFDDRFAAYFDALAADIGAPPVSRFAPRALELLRALSLRGGKRLRVALLHEGAGLVTAEDDVPGLAEAALSIELLQTHGLVHDDIIDDAPVRRGGPSTYYAYRGEFPEHERTALGLALLAGDLAAFLSVRVLLDAPVPAELRQALTGVQTRAAADTVVGQVMDLERDFLPRPDAGLLDTVTDYKSTRYSVLAPLRMGLLVAGGDLAAHDERLRRYAAPVGVLGQLRDDYLDLFGDEEVVGKPVGSDLRAGRRGYVLSATLAAATGPERETVERALGDPDCPAAAVDRVRDIARRHGVDDRVRAELRRLAGAASAEAATWRSRWRAEAVDFFEQLPFWAAERAL